MSFGWSGSDVFLLAQLAWNTVQNSRKACGEYDELTREALRLHAVLQRLEQEVAKPESPVNRPGETSKKQLERTAVDCEVVLRQLDKIVTAYAALSDEKRSVRKIWQRVRFGNGQLADLGDLRSKLMLYTSEMLLYLNLVSMGTVGRIEQRMNRDGGVLQDIKIAVERKTAHAVLCGGSRDGSVLTAYADDDTGFWKGLRRDLIKDGLPSAVIHKHKHLIMKYVKELGARGILDDGSLSENDQYQHEIRANIEITEDVQELSDDHDVNHSVPQKIDHNVEIQSLEDLNEQYLDYILDNTIAEDVEGESPHGDPPPAVLHIVERQQYNAIDDVGIRSGAKTKPQFESHKLKPLEPVHADDWPRKTNSLDPVSMRPTKKRTCTSEIETKTSRNDTAKPDDTESAAQYHLTSHASDHDGYFPRSIIELQREIDFLVRPTGVCHRSNMILLYKAFGQRINVMLECLPNRNLQAPQTAPGDDPYYIADLEVVANFALSAQKIIQDISDSRHCPSISLIDFRPEDFIDALGIRENQKIPQDLHVRIHELIATFDRQSYDAVDRIRQRKSSAFPRHTMPSKPPPKPTHPHDHDPGPQHPIDMHSGSRGGMPSNQSFRSSTSAAGWGFNGRNLFAVFAAFCAGSNIKNNNSILSRSASSKEKPVAAGKCRISDGSSSSENGPRRSEKERRSPAVAEPPRPSMLGESSEPSGTKSYFGASSSWRRDPRRSAIYEPSPEVKYPSKCRSETTPRDRIRPGNPVPLKSSKSKYMTMPSDANDSSSQSDCNHPLPRPAPFPRKTTFGISQDGADVIDPEIFRPRPKMSRGTSERLSMGSQEGSTRCPPVARAMASAISSDERRPDLGQHGSARVATLKTRDSDHGGEPRGKQKPYNKPYDKPYDKPNVTYRKTSENHEAAFSPDDLSPHMEGVSHRYDGSPPEYEANFSRHGQGSSPSDKINDITHKYRTRYEAQCQRFVKESPADAKERRKFIRQPELNYPATYVSQS